MAGIDACGAIITGIVLTADKSKLVTASYDKSFVVLEKESLRIVSRVSAAHTDLINTLAANPFNTNTIATAGNDGKVLTWDLRKAGNTEAKRTSMSCTYLYIFNNKKAAFKKFPTGD